MSRLVYVFDVHYEFPIIILNICNVRKILISNIYEGLDRV